ncbi:hypothetical protein OEZ85_000825 [Tetradesmus obliquus]|uniref:Uncharacterized protein n=1 Tax=Tetradesmus obliquus TaxID=3088 RepID=A0ABY8UJF1_TETOB|nr:hypothetical protein OEZ85_000825 [Tetradesmus obliquus]
MGAAVSTALGSSRQQYVQGLLQAATDLDWARAMAMSSDDWCAYQQRLITRLRTLLQLLQQQQQQGAACPELANQLSPAQRSAFAAAVLSGEGAAAAAAAADSVLEPEVEMVALIDDFNTLVNLAILHNPMPVRDCARRNCSTLAYQDVVPLEFWAAASARTGLSEEQLQQLRFGYSEYWRIMGTVQHKQQQLASSVASSTAAAAPKPWGLRGGSPLAAAAAAAATAPAQERDDLLQLLDEHMARWQTAAQLLLQFYCNTMTREQCAHMLVACWPYFPRMGSLVGAVAEAEHPGAFKRLEDHLQELQSQHAAETNRRKQQLAQQRQDYWRRLVVLREQQALQATVAQQQQQQQQLQQQRFVMQPTAAQLLLQFYCNTMTREQCAHMLVACWPYFPRMGSLVGAVAEAEHPGAFKRLEDHLQELRSQHAAETNRRKQQLAQQRQDYWRRLVVLREQQALQAAVAQQQQQQQQQQRFVMQPVHMVPRHY